MVVALTNDDRRKVVELLASIPDLGDAAGRRGVLEFAGLGDQARHIDLGGSAFAANNRVVGHLAAYGRVSRENEALGLFLNSVKLLVGEEQQRYLSTVLNRYAMMVPLSDHPAIGDWRGRDPAPDLAEKIIVANTLRPIAFVTQALRASRPVAYIEVRDGRTRWSGTGFLVSPELLLTNAHVLPRQEVLANAIFRFNYEDDEHGLPRDVSEFNSLKNGIFLTNTGHDYALLELAGRPGDLWGWLTLTEMAPAVGDRVNIIQHPAGQPKQIAFQSNLVQYVDGSVVQYVTATLPGSSGSPVFTDDWRVCAIHHAGGALPEPATGNHHFRNEGIRISQILADLPAEVRSSIAEAQR
jgi:V8-like Glu-specific endopeptidase